MNVCCCICDLNLIRNFQNLHYMILFTHTVSIISFNCILLSEITKMYLFQLALTNREITMSLHHCIRRTIPTLSEIHFTQNVRPPFTLSHFLDYVRQQFQQVDCKQIVCLFQHFTSRKNKSPF